MKKLIILLWVISMPALACDICGGYMGIIPNNNNSNISLNYRYRSFNGYASQNQHFDFFPALGHSHITSKTNTGLNPTTTNLNTIRKNGNNQVTQPFHGGSHSGTISDSSLKQSDYELFNTIELRAKYYLHPRWEINTIIPFVFNTMQMNDTASKTSGLGDITLFSGYHLINKMNDSVFRLRITPGVGIKLPTGKHHATNTHGDELPLSVVPGTGSTDFFPYLQAFTMYKRWGFNFFGFYRFNGKNHENAYLDNVTNLSASIFYQWKIGNNWTLQPAITGLYERTNGIYANSVKVPDTMMDVWLSGGGLDVFYKNWGLSVIVQWPVYEKVEYTDLGSAGWMMVNLNYFFKQQKFLVNSGNK